MVYSDKKQGNRHRGYLFLMAILCGTVCMAIENKEKKASSPFLQLSYQAGKVMPTNDFTAGNYPNGTPIKSSDFFSLQYGWHLNPNTWQYHRYGEQFQGFGLRYSAFGDPDYLGNPLTIYYFQGGNLFTFSRRFRLKYEVELGLTNGWKKYDPGEGYWNDATGGSFASAMIGSEVLLGYRFSPRWETELGVGACHFSNGAFGLPNMGLNQVQARIGLKYYLQPKESESASMVEPMPLRQKGIDWEVSAFITKRQRYLKTAPYVDIIKYDNIDYFVANLNIAPMFQTSYLFKIGASAEIMYDESCSVDLWLNSDKTKVEYSLAPFFKRFNIGVSAKAELVLPTLSFWSQIGYNVLHQTVDNERFYQVLGAKCPLNSTVSLIGGVRACSFRVAQCMFIGVQYTIWQPLGI